MLVGLGLMGGACAAERPKQGSAFYSAEIVAPARANIENQPWAAGTREAAVKAAEPWMKLSDDQLWDLMFGNTIKRSWMVWSNGFCPACKKGVPMYTWVMDPMNHPWKTQCPHCHEYFPKNDFAAFYRSGLDEHNVFDAKRADRSLLYNAEHPDPKDPLHLFGVDDGEGYVEGGNRWRFIGAYLIYGQWKQAIVGGITALSSAYVITGDPAYAHKAAVMLDRVADLYPTFDFGKEGVMYEGPPLAGYVSTWHDACEEARELAFSYDRIFEAMPADRELTRFLGKKAGQYAIENPKRSVEDVRRNIEEKILRDTLANRTKIESNYPQTDITMISIETVLGWPANREHIYEMIAPILDRATAVDGVTGEKGLDGYAAYAVSGTARFLAQFARLDPAFLADMLKRHPKLHDMFRFHIDTWCLTKYYPRIGDTGSFAARNTGYAGVSFGGPWFTKYTVIAPSMYFFLWQMYELTNDRAFVQALYRSNGNKTDGLPHDLFCRDSERIQKAAADVIAREGEIPKVGSVNFKDWRLAILRGGSGSRERDLWLDYDSGGGHGHRDGLNLGLFGFELDLLPDFGYPPVQFGGWSAPKSAWYMKTAAHNTVVVDGQNQGTGGGATTLWADGKCFRAIRASAPQVYEGVRQYERTAAMVNISDKDFYVLDVFRVVGGKDHAKFTSSAFATLATTGLELAPAEDYGNDTLMRNFRTEGSAEPGWSADFKVEDRYKYLKRASDIHLRYTDLTNDAEAGTCEAWINAAQFNQNDETWIPRLVVRRRGRFDPLVSTFVSVIEPYEGTSHIASIHRLPLAAEGGQPCPDTCAAVEVTLADGSRDLVISIDAEDPLGLAGAKGEGATVVQGDWGVTTDAELCMIRLSPSGRVKRVSICNGTVARIKNVETRLKKRAEFTEIEFERGRAVVVSGDPANLE